MKFGEFNFPFFLIILFLFSCSESKKPLDINIIKGTPTQNPCPLGVYNGVSISYQNTRAEVDDLGANMIHFWMQWDLTEPQLTEPFVKVSDVTDDMIQEYSSGEKEGVDWTFFDNYFEEFSNLNFIVSVGSGWLASLPKFNGEKITPDLIGIENYLGQLYLYTRSCVRRYGSKVIGWQIENEPNVAAETLLVGIRKGDSWSDKDFVTDVLSTLESAVRAEDSNSWITINFHTDIHFEEDLKRWLPLIDIVGIDAYPNYFNGDTIKSDVVLDRINRARELSEGKPVFLMETGYASAPISNGFSEEKQSIFIDEIYSKISDSGGCGAFFFKLSSPEENGTGLFPQENYWGLIRSDDSYKPGWQTLKNHLN